jgi:hypothetical protein
MLLVAVAVAIVGGDQRHLHSESAANLLIALRAESHPFFRMDIENIGEVA